MHQLNILSFTKDAIVFANKRTLTRLSKNKSEYKVEINRPLMAMASHNNMRQIFTLDIDGNIRLYDEGLNEIQHRYGHIEGKVFNQLFHDNSGTLWLVNNQEVIRLSEQPSINHPHIFNTSINAMDITPIDNTIAIGSYGDGLQNFNGKAAVFPPQINEALSEKAHRIMDTVSYENRIYFATFDGLWFYDNSTQSVKKIDLNQSDDILLKLTIKQDKLFIGTNSNGFIIYDLKARKVTKTVDKHFPLTSPEVIDVLPLENDDIWLATSKGIDIYNP